MSIIREQIGNKKTLELRNAIREQARQQIIQRYREGCYFEIEPVNPQTLIMHLNQILSMHEQIGPYLKYQEPILRYLLYSQQMDQEVKSLLIRVAPVLYQHLMENKSNRGTIQILKVVSAFNIVIPQTKQLAEWLMTNIVSMQYVKMADALQIAANLLTHHFYQHTLKAKLQQCGFFEELLKIISNNTRLFETLNYQIPYALVFISQILVIYLLTPPLLQLQIASSVIRILKMISGQEPGVKFAILREMGNMSEHIQKENKEMKTFMKLMLSEWEYFLGEENYGFEIDCIEFLDFCSKFNIFSENKSVLDFLTQIHGRSLPNTPVYLHTIALYIQNQIIHPSTDIIHSCLSLLPSLTPKHHQNLLNILCHCSFDKPSLIYQFLDSEYWQLLIDLLFYCITSSFTTQESKYLCLQLLSYCVEYEHNSQNFSESFSFIKWLAIMGGKQAIENISVGEEDEETRKLAEGILEIIGKY